MEQLSKKVGRDISRRRQDSRNSTAAPESVSRRLNVFSDRLLSHRADGTLFYTENS